jgi:hypothetical protein
MAMIRIAISGKPARVDHDPSEQVQCEAVGCVARHLSCTLLALRSVPAKSASLAVCDV